MSHGGSDNNHVDESSKPKRTSFRQELARRLYCPEPRVNQVETSIESSLSVIPWTLRYNNITVENLTGDHYRQPSAFLPVSYLDLRRQQNIAFADEKYKEASTLSSLEITKAQTLYKQALDLVPDHLDSLLGYGKILVRNTQFQKARRIFHDAVEVDPNNVVAKQYLSSIEKTLLSQLTKNDELRQQQQETNINQSLLLKKGKNLTTRESSAYQDALMERNLALLDDNPFDGENEEEVEVDSDEDDGRGQSRKRDIDRYKKRKRRKRYKRRKENKNKKRKRRRYDTSSSSSSSSSSIISSDTSISSAESSKSPQKSDPNNGEDNDTKITKSDIKSHPPIAEESSERRTKVDTTKDTPTTRIENKNNPESGEGDDSYKEHRRHRRRRKDNKARGRRERTRTKKRSKHSAKKKSRRRKEKDIVDDDSQASSSIEEE
jgi:hypothetical protein